ncbi:uncharacterized protein MELLADRAFT_71442 [Melampsora larici-populina 98AG31]|uniref:Uncharacterized protein n=1 Tax=Melampsora larici-populina (strain 98AG31 / pathotype 3-4-7) TaxID=747676 RepID=F4RG53_MELLP|nr:uncharacterized protein MELLADRAFT_71442 [Melampsora larici-populina 98AG31]EGG08549.1 hypothetical protein MELLADRAFT_71442 [Melampsora larici-populina 98AG31]
MDCLHRSRYQKKMTIYTSKGSELEDLPAKLWKAIFDDHSRQSEHYRAINPAFFRAMSSSYLSR